MTGAGQAAGAEPTATPEPGISSEPGSRSQPGPLSEPDDADDAYLARVMAEIGEEARLRRAEIPARVERELDALFLAHSPVSGRGADLSAAIRAVDGAAFIDPVVPVRSQRSGGALVKKGLRSLSLWYMSYVTHQVSHLAATVSGALHAVEVRLDELRRDLPPWQPAPVLQSGDADAWWRAAVVETLAGLRGRVVHMACGDGWLVRALVTAGADAYGVDPRPGLIDRAELAGDDLRLEDPAHHLRAVAPAALDGVVLSGVVDGMVGAERDALLALVADRLAPEGRLVIHSLSPAAWTGEAAPLEADLAPGHPLRPATWAHVLKGWAVDVREGPGGGDYLVIAHR